MKKVLFTIISTLIFANISFIPTFALQPLKYIEGIPAFEMMVLTDSTVVVESETLIFDFKNKDYRYGRNAKVTVSYILDNPSDKSQSIRFALPVISSKNILETKIILNNNEVPFKVYFGDNVDKKSSNQDYLGKLNTDKIQSDLNVVPYKIKSGDNGTLYTINHETKADLYGVILQIKFDKEKSDIIYSGFDLETNNPDYITLRAITDNNQRDLFFYVIGEPV